MSAWPLALAQQYPAVDSYSESPPDTGLRTEMDAGPAKQRRRYTAGPRAITASVTLRTKAELDVLDDFFVNTLQGGVLPFDWKDRNGVARVFRFVAGKDAMRYEPIQPDVWVARMKLEILP